MVSFGGPDVTPFVAIYFVTCFPAASVPINALKPAEPPTVVPYPVYAADRAA